MTNDSASRARLWHISAGIFAGLAIGAVIAALAGSAAYLLVGVFLGIAIAGVLVFANRETGA